MTKVTSWSVCPRVWVLLAERSWAKHSQLRPFARMGVAFSQALTRLFGKKEMRILMASL